MECELFIFHPICLLKPHQFAKAKEIKHRLLVSVPREKYPPWLRNAFKQAYHNIQRLEALGPPVKGALPPTLPYHTVFIIIDCQGDRYNPLKNAGGDYQLQVSWKIWEKMERDDATKPLSSAAITLSGKQSPSKLVDSRFSLTD